MHHQVFHAFCLPVNLCYLMVNSRLSRCWWSGHSHQCVPDRLNPYRAFSYSFGTHGECLCFGHNQARNDYLWILGQVGVVHHQICDISFNFVPRTARVWKNFNSTYELRGHTQAVWAVVAIDDDQFLTGTDFETKRSRNVDSTKLGNSQALQTRRSVIGSNTRE
jgi:hypothetical protein